MSLLQNQPWSGPYTSDNRPSLLPSFPTHHPGVWNPSGGSRASLKLQTTYKVLHFKGIPPTEVGVRLNSKLTDPYLPKLQGIRLLETISGYFNALKLVAPRASRI